ncbi:MAG: hypothetical protein HUK28_04510 [Methanobrevibacter sp.]|nr:hypothetical protein [Methanobrevibacter sp.]
MDIDNVSESKVDVRLIVSGPDMAQLVSKAIDDVDFEEDYNIIVSSIIPTTDLKIAKKVSKGADIILIGGAGNDETYNILYNELKDEFNHVGLFNYNNIINVDEEFDYKLARSELLNSIIKSGLTYSLNIINIHTLENKLVNLTRKYNNLLDDYNQLIEENKSLTQDNSDLQDEINKSNDKISNLKSDFSTFKTRYEDIHNKDIVEVFNLSKLWRETFNEELTDENKLFIATNKFKPNNIIMGQNQIGARDKQSAIEWIKILKTSLILVNQDDGSLKNELDEINDNPYADEEHDNISNSLGNFFD